MFKVMAKFMKTNEVLTLGIFDTYDEAQWNIDNNIEWDEDDNPSEWELYVEAEVEDEDCYCDYEVGFDPYLGCYSDEVQPSRSLY